MLHTFQSKHQTRRFKSVVPKLVRAVTQIKVGIMSFYPKYFAVIAHDIEEHRGFGSILPLEESHITSEG